MVNTQRYRLQNSRLIENQFYFILLYFIHSNDLQVFLHDIKIIVYIFLYTIKVVSTTFHMKIYIIIFLEISY